MTAICIENKYGNTNFKKGNRYTVDKDGITTEWGGIRIRHAIEPKNNEFELGLCKFKIKDD